MKLGITYNLFDSQELLERSIVTIKGAVDYVCVVYQIISNFGNVAHPHLENLLQDLQKRKIIDDIILYVPRSFSLDERKKMVSPRTSETELGAPIENIADQFFNELSKREIGRIKCKENACTHFMSIDADEFYKIEELKNVKEIMQKYDYDGTACRMRYFFKEPTYQLMPHDEINSVTLIYKIKDKSEFKLACSLPNPGILVDPTRRLDNLSNFKLFERDIIEMYHMSFVRKDMRRKMMNVSNRGNYQYNDLESFLQKFETWTPENGILHPHPFFQSHYKYIETIPNYFDIHLDKICCVCFKSATKRCSKCKKVNYCSVEHQALDYPTHKYTCK